jgi:hypothetical protein
MARFLRCEDYIYHRGTQNIFAGGYRARLKASQTRFNERRVRKIVDSPRSHATLRARRRHPLKRGDTEALKEIESQLAAAKAASIADKKARGQRVR